MRQPRASEGGRPASEAATPPVVRARDIFCTFRTRGPWPWSPATEVRALQGVDLEVREGEVVALVGRSGSGKTTLARIVLGLEEPTGGRVELEGRPWSGRPERERQPRRVRYQYVPQDPMAALDPQQTALEHVEETLRVLGRLPGDRAREQARAMLDRLGLGQRAHALPRDLSGGEQRRVTLARVLALSPRLVVADEPTSGLEEDLGEAVLRDLVGNLPEGAACILVTHDLAAARRWAHRALVMLSGRVVEELDVRSNAPFHPYAQLLFDPWSHPLPRHPPADTGCPFHPDCPLVDEALAERCARDVPSLRSLGRSHRVACHAATPASG